MEKDRRFLNFPIIMLRELYVNSKSFINDVFDVGIYLYSQTLEGDEAKQFKDAESFLMIKNGNLQNAKKVLSKLPDKYPIAGIDRDMLFDYYRNYKSEFEIVCLGAFLGIKSIIGKKIYDKTNLRMIHARMFGYSSYKDLPKDLTDIQKKYQARRQMNNVLFELQTKWHLKIYSNHDRGIYISFDLPLEQLVAIVDKHKRKAKIQELKDAKRKAIEMCKKRTT